MGWQDLSRSTHLGSPRIFCWNFSVYVWHLKILTSKSSPPHMCFVSVESVNWKSRELWAPKQNPFLRLSQDECQIWHREHPFKTSANFSQYLTLTPLPFLLLSIGKIGQLLTPPPLKSADVLNGWSHTWIALNFLLMIWTMRSISLAVIGLVRLCSRRRFMTWVVNSLQPWSYFSTSCWYMVRIWASLFL